MIGRVDWISRPWRSIGGTYPLSVTHSRRRKFGWSLMSCPWIRLLGLMGSRVAFIALLGRSSKGMSFVLLMLSPLWISAASTTSMTPSSFSCQSRPIYCLWATIALLATSTAFGKKFPKHLLTALLWCCLSRYPQTKVLLSQVARFRTIFGVSSGQQRF
jgi:hypothetical protein